MTQPILTSPQELETWLDEFMVEQMDKLHIPGVTFSLVQNGELFFAKGYGYADLEQQIPVIADCTLFRVGSISKLFTATAIMQLVEKELLDLDDDVNKYLQNFQIENNYPQPVTIANLLTHTAGFHKRFIGMQALSASDVIPLGEYLKVRMPALVLPPGEAMTYSNHGYALAGYLVELVAGIPFSQYIDDNILQPLAMHRSSFDLPPHLAPDLSLSYRYRKKQKNHQALPFDHLQTSPAGALSATATDMANFAIAHLQHGKFKSQRILATTTAQQMQQQQFTHAPCLPGIGWGFIEFFANKQRAIGHGGGISGFRSFLYLLPSHNLGFFVSDNGGGNISRELIKQFLERYFSVDKNPVSCQPSPEKRQRLKLYQGSYRGNCYGRRSLEKTLLLFSSSLRIKAEANGTLSIPKTLKSPNPVYIQEVEPLVLKPIDDEDLVVAVAKESDDGKITDLFVGNGVLEKLAWYETQAFHWMLIWWFILVFFSGCIVSILALTRFPEDSWHQLAQSLSGLTCGLNLVFIIGMLLFEFVSRNNYRLQIYYGMPKIVTLLLWIPLLTSVLAMGLPVVAVLAWIKNDWSFIEQLHYSLVSLTALGLIPFLNYWNLLGFRY
ncbi:MAG: serine hydrolase domain-containing protein [Xenococcaceae cyanobacterium MO_234.B1]|nr:serine hydrolase domain-containing protein [Xenococcaceae cyanobacterium MO_234.B1]